MSLTVKHLEKLQVELQNDPSDYQIELRDGEIIIMDLSDIVSSYIGAQLSRLLGNSSMMFWASFFTLKSGV